MPNSKIDYTYILAASHSGSTLLALLLNAHPDIATVGELDSGGIGSLDGYLCSCREPLEQCPFWRAVTGEMVRRRADFSVRSLGTRFQTPDDGFYHWLLAVEHRGPVLEALRDLILGVSPRCRRLFAAIAGNSRNLVEVVLQLTGARIFVDSSKHAHRLEFLRRIPAFEMKVIHLVRDGRAVTATYLDQDRYADAADPALRRGGRGSGAPSPYALTIPMAQAADEWRRYLRSEEHVLAGLDRSRWIEVRYEDLCRDVDATMRRIFEFLNVDPARRVRDFRAVAHHVMGNGMRLDASCEVPLDERWKTALTPQDRQMFEAVAGNINRRYGYT